MRGLTLPRLLDRVVRCADCRALPRRDRTPAKIKAKRNAEYTYRRENGDLDTLILCADCRPTLDDYATVISKCHHGGECDRCGRPST